MKFEIFRDWTVRKRERENALSRAGERDWLLPGMNGLLTIHVSPGSDDPQYSYPTNVRIGYSKGRNCEGGSTTLRDGFEVKGLYFDYMPDGIGMLDQLQLGFVLRAREIIDSWIRGDIDDLPAQPFL